MKKIIFIVIVLLVSAGIIFAGGKKESEENKSSVKVEKIDLSLWGWIFTGNDGAAIRSAVEDYQNENPHVNIELMDVNWAQAHDNLILMSQSGNMPDIVMVNRTWLVEAVSLDILEDLTPRVKAAGMDFYPAVRGDYEGKDYVLPYAGGNSALIINKTLFKEYGLTPPTTFDEFVSIAETVSDPDSNFYGTAFCISETNVAGANVCNLAPIIYSFGGRFVENGKAALNSPEVVEAFQWMIDLEKKQKLATPGSTTIDARKMREIMVAKNVLMVFDGAWGASRYEGIEIEIVKMPKMREVGTVVNIANWGLPKNGKNNEAAWDFLEFLYSDKYLEMHFDNGVLPFTPKFGELPKYQEKFSGFLNTLADSENYFQTGSLPNETELYRLTVKAYQEAYLGVKSVQAALDDANAKYDTILKEFYAK